MLLILVHPAHASIYLDGTTTGCTDGNTDYSPLDRSCGSGSDTVYDNLSSFSSNIAAEATNFIRAGSYFRDTGDNLVGSLHISSSKSGTSGNPTIVKAYPGEELQVIIGTQTRQDTYNSDPDDATGSGSWSYYPNPSLGTYDTSYVTIDGIKTFGQVYLAGGHDVILQNSDCGGGGGSGSISSDQGNTIRLLNIYNATLKNNKIHHNCRRVEDDNGSLIIGYDFSSSIEQNTLYDGYGTYFENKDAGGQTGRTTTVKNNLFSPTTISTIDTVGFRGLNQDAAVTNLYINNNIFLRLDVGVHVIGVPTDDNVIYNNTFVDCDVDIRQPTPDNPFEAYNNLHYHSGTGDTFVYVYGLSSLDAADYNVYSGSANWVNFTGSNSTSLAAWQSYSSLDTNSLSHNPDFVNASGTAATDFKRLSYTEDFTGSPHSTRAGAYVTGNEVIGVEDEHNNVSCAGGTTSASGGTVSVVVQ